MARSLKKGAFTHPSILKKIDKLKQGDRTPIKTWSRNSTIIPQMVGFTFGIHTGRDFFNLLITEEHVGHKLGEFAATRKFIRHGGRMAKEEEGEGQATKREE